MTKKYLKMANSWNGLPAFIHPYEIDNTLSNHFFLSIVSHITGFIFLWALFTTLNINEINPLIKTDKIPKDIVFSIKDSSSPRAKKGKSLRTEIKQTNVPETIKPKTNTNDSLDDFSIPMPKLKPISSGSRTLGSRTGSSSGQTTNSSGEIGHENGSAKGVGTSNGNGFDKNTARKTLIPYDISPYVNELKHNVRMNWKQPKTGEGKYVELFLRIAKDGRLIILNVKRTSEVGEVDNAALNAVRRSLPLNPLPSKYNKSYLDLVFTFNSTNSSLGSRY